MSPSENTLFDLSHLTLLKISGEHAATFLQGQLSCDVNQVNTNEMRQGAFCNLKGRVLALPDVLYFNYDFYLLLPRSLMEKTEKSLAKTAALSRVTLEPASHHAIWGFYLKDINQPLPLEGTWPQKKYAVHATDQGLAYCLGDGFYILIQTTDAQNHTIPQKDASDWHQLRLQHEDFQIYPESRGLFLPHRLGLHTKGHLNFEKGCYRGQEIIARTHYRAKLKHALMLFNITTTEALQPGLRIMNEAGTQEVGELVDYAPTGESHYLIAASILTSYPEKVCFENHSATTVLKPYTLPE